MTSPGKAPGWKSSLHQHWPLYAGVSIFLIVLFVILNDSIRQNHGRLIYMVDDAYIGMAMARNFAQYGVWGTTRYGFSSCSSPPLWTLSLSFIYYLTGAHQVTPLILSLVFALATFLLAYHMLQSYKVPPIATFLTLLAFIFLVPFPALVMIGMEPTMQIFLSMLMVFVAARWVSGESPATSRRDAVSLLALAPLATGVRMEGLFLVIAISIVLLFCRRWVYVLAFSALGYLPWFIYGLISVSKGWYWLPTSVLLKTSPPKVSSVGDMLLSVLFPIHESSRTVLHVPALLLAVLLLFIAASGKGSAFRESRQVMSVILLLVGLAQLELIRPTLLYRYDAYLTTLCILVVALQLPVVVPQWPSFRSWATWTNPRVASIAALVVVFTFPLIMEGGLLTSQITQCTTNIYEQQYQMGLFIRKYYQGGSVALNDIGAVNYLADVHCLDMWGLASLPVARARHEHRYQVDVVENAVAQAQVKIAIIYDVWFTGLVPSNWVRVGTWTIRNNMVCANETVSIYAVDPAEAPHLTQCLRDFSAQLPADVIQQGPYLAYATGGSGP